MGKINAGGSQYPIQNNEIKKAGQKAKAAQDNPAPQKDVQKQPVDLDKVKTKDIKSAKTGPTDQAQASAMAEKAEFAATLRDDPEFLDAVTKMLSTEGNNDDIMETAKLTAMVKKKAKEFLSPEAYEQFSKSVGLPDSKATITGKINALENENASPEAMQQSVSKLVSFIAGETVNLSAGLPGC